MTIPAEAFRGAGLAPGDRLTAEASGAGKVVLTRVAELAERYSGALDSGGSLRSEVDRLRREWR